jgi:predicted component of type VI protein secretion system
MKKLLLLTLVAGVAVAMTGCVNTVDDRSRVGVPLVKDQLAARYQRPMAEVFEAAKRSLSALGTLDNESTKLATSNSVRLVEGRVNQRMVWVRVEALEPRMSEVTVQARSKLGADITVAHEVEKRIALELAR